MDEQRPDVVLEKLISQIRKSCSFLDDDEIILKEKHVIKDRKFRDSYNHSDDRTSRPWSQLIDGLFEEQERGIQVLKEDWNGFAKGTERKVIDDWFGWHHGKKMS